MRPVKRNSEGEKVRRKDRGKMPLMEVVGGSGDRDKVRLEPVVRGGKPQYVESTNQLLRNLENMAYADEINKGVDAKISAEESAKARKKAEEEAAIQARNARLKALGYDPSVDLNAEIPESPRGYLHWDQITPGRATRALTYADAINTYPSAATQEELFQLFQSDPALAELWANSADNQSFYEAQKRAAFNRATQVRQEVDRQFPGQGTPGYRAYGYYPWDSNPNLATTYLGDTESGPTPEFYMYGSPGDQYAPVDIRTKKRSDIQSSDPQQPRVSNNRSLVNVWNPINHTGVLNQSRSLDFASDVTGWDAPDYVDENGNLHPVSKQRPSMLTDVDEAYRQSRVGRFDAYMNSLMYNNPEQFSNIYGLFTAAKQELPPEMFDDFVAAYISRTVDPSGRTSSDRNSGFMDQQISNDFVSSRGSITNSIPFVVQVPAVAPDGSIYGAIIDGTNIGSYIDDGIQDGEREKYFTREFTGHPTNAETYKFFEDYYANVNPDDWLNLQFPAQDVIRPNDKAAIGRPELIGGRKIHKYPDIVHGTAGGFGYQDYILLPGESAGDISNKSGARVVKNKDLYQAVADRYPNTRFQTRNGPNQLKIWNGL
jgi:hypothetical protein